MDLGTSTIGAGRGELHVNSLLPCPILKENIQSVTSLLSGPIPQENISVGGMVSQELSMEVSTPLPILINSLMNGNFMGFSGSVLNFQSPLATD